MITVYNEKTTNINGKEYWLVSQFARLTQRTDGSIRVLINKGNRIRKIKAISINTTLFIEANELFDYPFVVVGRPKQDNEIYIERFYMENEELIREETIYKEEDAIEICQ